MQRNFGSVTHDGVDALLIPARHQSRLRIPAAFDVIEHPVHRGTHIAAHKIRVFDKAAVNAR